MAGLLPAGQSPAGDGAQTPAGPTGKGAGVRRWANRLLQRGHSAGSMPVTPLNGEVMEAGHGHGFTSKTLLDTLMGKSAVLPSFPNPDGTHPVVPVQTAANAAARPKPVPPPRTSSCLSSSSAGCAPGIHQDGIPRPPPPSALMMAQEIPTKSVRFGQQQQQQLQQQMDPAGRREQDALAEATIGLEIAANLALAFARDVRRERHMQMAETAGPSSAPAAAPPAPLPPAGAPPPVRRPQHPQQEVTLSEFYQLLQFVSHHTGKATAGHAQQPPPSQKPLPHPHPPPSSALKPPPASQQFPPGYLTARAFRQNRKAHQHPSGGDPLVSPGGTRRSHSVDANHPNPPPPDMDKTDRVASAAPPAQQQHITPQLKTRSLPRTVRPAGGPAASEGSASGPPVGHWAEILGLISQVLSRADQYEAHPHHPPQTVVKRPAPARKPPAASSAPSGGGSVSDSEEAYHRRQLASALRSAETGRPYETLKNPSRGNTRPSSRASNAAEPSGGGAGGGHQSYLASLTQRLQLEQYIAKTLAQLLKKNEGTGGEGRSEETPGPAGYIECWGSPERVAAPGPASGKNGKPGSSLGLERALLRLDQRRTDRHPRMYQHHHWRITPSECNALFLCKV